MISYQPASEPNGVHPHFRVRGDDVVVPERVRLRRTKGWRKPPNTVTVARPSRWGNPFPAKEAAQRYPSLTPDEARRFVVNEFRDMLRAPKLREWQGYPSDDEIRRELRGKNLACWCPEDGPCHADVLLEIANR
jgi:hypothetical protein